MNAPQPLLELLERLNKAGFEACFVGGCVRDAIRGRQPGDYDIATAAEPSQVERLFRDKRVVETGLRHGTVTVITDGFSAEITTYRTESGYSDHRHPDAVMYTRSLREDLARRDFTVNALAYIPGKGVIDPFGGITDIENKRLRCVGDPEKRFTEDSLRILRAVRFSATLGFEVEQRTAAAAFSLRDSLRFVSAERILTELTKLLCGENASEAILNFADILRVIIPCFPNDEQLPATANALKATAPNIISRFSVLLRGCGAEQTNSVMKQLRASNAIRKSIVAVTAELNLPTPNEHAAVCRSLNRISPELFFRYIEAVKAFAAAENDKSRLSAARDAEKEAQAILKNGDCYCLRQLAINGSDIIAAGYDGKKTGELLNLLLDAVISGSINNEKKALLGYLPKIK